VLLVSVLCQHDVATHAVPTPMVPAAMLLRTKQAFKHPVLYDKHQCSTLTSTGYYHGYVLAEMSVHQTRAYFNKKLSGKLVDNPQVCMYKLCICCSPVQCHIVSLDNDSHVTGVYRMQTRHSAMASWWTSHRQVGAALNTGKP
jgi:hypothetical protein